jgi:hypothetical protein
MTSTITLAVIALAGITIILLTLWGKTELDRAADQTQILRLRGQVGDLEVADATLLEQLRQARAEAEMFRTRNAALQGRLWDLETRQAIALSKPARLPRRTTVDGDQAVFDLRFQAIVTPYEGTEPA